jgi:hypothetical protein
VRERESNGKVKDTCIRILGNIKLLLGKAKYTSTIQIKRTSEKSYHYLEHPVF